MNTFLSKLASSSCTFCRCNGNNDCADASDEVNCDKISVLDTYLNEVPAPPLDGNELTDVTLNVDIIQVHIACRNIFANGSYMFPKPGAKAGRS